MIRIRRSAGGGLVYGRVNAVEYMEGHSSAQLEISVIREGSEERTMHERGAA